MIDKPSGDDTDEFLLFGSELSDREVYAIGKIVSLWGALEYEIFLQTYDSFNPTSLDQLPREMNNQQSSKVLELWKKQVVDKAEGKRQVILQMIYEKILEVTPHRNAIVHGMWDWEASAPEKIKVSRVKKDEIITHSFTADQLGQFARLLAKMNFKIRYPGGFEEYVKAMASQTFYMSRQFVAITTNNPSAKDWFSLSGGLNDIPSPPDDDQKTPSDLL